MKLPLLFVTHNRTEIASRCLTAICSLIPNIYVYICDERSSTEHINTLENICKKFNVEFKTIHCTKDHYGYGYVVNQAVKDAIANGHNVFMINEDDRLIEENVDFYKIAAWLEENKEFGKLRTSLNDNEIEKFKQLYALRDMMFNDSKIIVKEILKQTKAKYINNLQCGMWHKRMFDYFGQFKENCGPDPVEVNLMQSYNTAFRSKDAKVDCPKIGHCLLPDNKPIFKHIGETCSTLGHLHGRARKKPKYKRKIVKIVRLRYK